MDGYSDFEIWWRITIPVGMPAILTTAILNIIIYGTNSSMPWCSSPTTRSGTPAARHPEVFCGDRLEDIGMIATGMMIAVIPIIAIYALFSEKLIQGMTAGAVK
jgi:multiple sugar transport system permease protein/raffinose/stachyose/melibiose transport system permease protein